MVTLQAGRTDLDLAQEIKKALDENRARWAEARDAKTHLDPSWEFARILLRLEAFAELEGYEALDLVRELVPDVKQKLPSETSLGVPADPFECFLDAWETILVPEGASSVLRQRIERAVAQARDTPPEPGRYGPRFAHSVSGRARVFMRAAELLQEMFGRQPVPIPQEVFADVLDCHQTEVSRWVRRARRASLLMPASPPNHRKRLCAEYRFVPYLDPEIE